MNLLHKIPFIRQVYRSREKIDELEASLAQYQQDLATLHDALSVLSTQRDELVSRNEGLEKALGELVGREQALEERCAQRADDITSQINHLKGDAYFDEQNVKRTIRPTVWGDSRRLHISPKASLLSCHFNVNSGEITVGDYTFCGSKVSILAGSHDMMLTGFLRRDVEVVDGCDIHIGEGVWLGSNSTILGPATIGDHAVVAAGAVVTPGTAIEPCSIYGGVPARFIKKIEPIIVANDKTNSHIVSALERNHGLLCVDGWWEKYDIVIDGWPRRVHRMIDRRAIILASSSDMDIYVSCTDAPDADRVADRKDEQTDYVASNQLDDRPPAGSGDHSGLDKNIYATIYISDEYIDRNAMDDSITARNIFLKKNAITHIDLPKSTGDSMWVVLEADIEAYELYVLMK